jgi:signal transduction histidine kinase
MRRLWVRLTLAFGLVTLVGMGTVAVLTDWQAGEHFRQYVAQQARLSEADLVETLAGSYLKTGSWTNVSEVVDTYYGNRPGGQRRGRPPVLLIDTNNIVIYDDHNVLVGQTLPPEDQQNTLPVVANNQTVGYLVLPTFGRSGASQEGELAFIDKLRYTLSIAALAAGGLSVVLGLVISRTLTAPLARLAEAARTFGARDWQHRIPEKGTKEVVEAARAFNEMAVSLEQAETLRRTLMADIAHELRTPLTVLQGNLRAMLDGVYPLERGEVATLYDETRLLSRLVDDLRELALVESGKLTLNVQSADLRPLLATTVDNFGIAAETKAVQLSLDVPHPLPWVKADIDRIRQVLFNLLGNALRYTPEGGRITVSALATAGGVQVAVADNGEGIAPGDLPHVFDRFYRGDNTAHIEGNTGLGLAISKAWVAAMGGAVGAESTLGRGSRFWFTLPSV